MAASPLEQLLKEKPVALLDGGFATCLEENYGITMHRQLWSAHAIITHPTVIAQVHYDYLESGADIIETSSYQASHETFKQALDSDPAQVDDYLRKSVELAQDAIYRFQTANPSKRRPLLAASMGPFGSTTSDAAEFHGKYVETMSNAELKSFHRRRVSIFKNCPFVYAMSCWNCPNSITYPNNFSSGVDLLAFETVPSLVEAQAIGQMLRDDAVTIPAWITFSCKSESLTCHDEIFEDAIKAVLEFPQFVAVGVNCTAPKFVKALLEKAKKVFKEVGRSIFLIAYPNKGERYDAELQKWVAADSEGNIHDCVQDWLEIGVQIVGGCCRTRPEDIQRLSHVISSTYLSKST